MKWKTKLDVTGKTPNQWDDTIHQDDGVRTFRDGTPLQYPNWQVGQFYGRHDHPTSLYQRRHKKKGTPKLDVSGKEVNQFDASIHFANGTRAMADGTVLEWPNWQKPTSLAQDWDYINQKVNVTGMSVNQWDQTVHLEDGSRVHPDGTKVTWPNWQPAALSQTGEGPPAELVGAAGAKCVPNIWDGLCHNPDGTKTFLNGYPVDGVNQWAQKGQRLYQDDSNTEDVTGFSDYIAKKNQRKLST